MLGRDTTTKAALIKRRHLTGSLFTLLEVWSTISMAREHDGMQAHPNKAILPKKSHSLLAKHLNTSIYVVIPIQPASYNSEQNLGMELSMKFFHHL